MREFESLFSHFLIPVHAGCVHVANQHTRESGVAQRKRVGLITQRSVDRNHPSLLFCLQPTAALAQLGERQTEDLKVPGSIPGGGIFIYLMTLL